MGSPAPGDSGLAAGWCEECCPLKGVYYWHPESDAVMTKRPYPGCTEAAAAVAAAIAADSDIDASELRRPCATAILSTYADRQPSPRAAVPVSSPSSLTPPSPSAAVPAFSPSSLMPPPSPSAAVPAFSPSSLMPPPSPSAAVPAFSPSSLMPPPSPSAAVPAFSPSSPRAVPSPGQARPTPWSGNQAEVWRVRSHSSARSQLDKMEQGRVSETVGEQHACVGATLSRPTVSTVRIANEMTDEIVERVVSDAIMEDETRMCAGAPDGLTRPNGSHRFNGSSHTTGLQPDDSSEQVHHSSELAPDSIGDVLPNIQREVTHRVRLSAPEPFELMHNRKKLKCCDEAHPRRAPAELAGASPKALASGASSPKQLSLDANTLVQPVQLERAFTTPRIQVADTTVSAAPLPITAPTLPAKQQTGTKPARAKPKKHSVPSAVDASGRDLDRGGASWPQSRGGDSTPSREATQPANPSKKAKRASGVATSASAARPKPAGNACEPVAARVAEVTPQAARADAVAGTSAASSAATEVMAATVAQTAAPPEAVAPPEAGAAPEAAEVGGTSPGPLTSAPEGASSLEPGLNPEEEVVDFVCDALELPPTPATIATALLCLDDQHLDWSAMTAGWTYQHRKWVERLMMVEKSRLGAADGTYVRGLCDLTVQLQRCIKPRRLQGWFMEKSALATWLKAVRRVTQNAGELVAPVTALAMAVRGVAEPPEWLASVGGPPPPRQAQASPAPAPPSSLSPSQESTTLAAPAEEAETPFRQPRPQEESSGTNGPPAALSAQPPAQPPAEAAAPPRPLLVSAAAGEESAVAPADVTPLTASTQDAMLVEEHDTAPQAAAFPLQNSVEPRGGSAPPKVTPLALPQNGCAPSDDDDSQTGSPPLLQPNQGSPAECQAVHATNGASGCGAKGSVMTVSTNGKGALPVGTHVRGRYLASSRGKRWNQWYHGSVSSVRRDAAGQLLYSIDYFDGDHEDGVLPKHIRLVSPSQSGARTARQAPNEANPETV